MRPDLESLRSLWREARNFLLVGLAATAAHFAVMAALIASTMASALAATFIGSLTGSIVTYLANRRITFQSDTPHRRALPRHYIVVAGSIVLNALAFRVAHEQLSAKVWVAQGLATGLCMVFNFIVSRWWVVRSS
ncbi:MAG: GtrA family protein [Betaproteobacteria bacterium]